MNTFFFSPHDEDDDDEDEDLDGVDLACNRTPNSPPPCFELSTFLLSIILLILSFKCFLAFTNTHFFSS